MENKKKELEQGMKAAENAMNNKTEKKGSILSKLFGENKTETKEPDYSVFALPYEEAKKQKGYEYLSLDQYNNTNERLAKEGKLPTKPEQPQQPQQPKVEPTKPETWQDRVKAGTATDEDMQTAYDAYKNGSYTPGPKTKEYFDNNFEAKTEPTIDNALDAIDTISEQDPQVEAAVKSLTNQETGEVEEKKTRDSIEEWQKALVELGAAEYDMDGNFVLKPTSNAKGWETWATMLSVGLSVLGIAMGIPIIPVNFKAITGKDTRDAQIQALQQQYMNVMGDAANNVKQMKSDVEAGQIAMENPDALAAQEKHSQATAATKDVIGAQTNAEKDLIETRTDEEIRKDEAQWQRDKQRLEMDRDFQLKFAALQQQYAKEMAQLQSDLTTESAIDVMKYQNSGFIKDLKNLNMSFSDIAKYTAAKNGISPADKNWNRVKMLSDMVTGGVNAAGNIFKKKE